MNIFVEQPMNFFQRIRFSIAAVVVAALMIAVFVLTLALLALLSQMCADALGYKLVISDEVAKAVIAVGGAIGVGFLALYGVQQQNFSAEKRHKVDSSLALRKEIFLQVAEAASVQFEFLLSFGNPKVTDADRKSMSQEIGKAFFKLQMVASQDTICAMLDANEEWTRAMFDIMFFGAIPPGNDGPLTRLSEIQKRATPFMQKLWRFNMIARKEIECEFRNDVSYFSMMDEKFGHVAVIFDDLKQRLATVKNQG